MIQVAPHHERVFKALVEKAKILEAIKHMEREKRKNTKALIKRFWSYWQDKTRQNITVASTEGKSLNFAYCCKKNSSEY